MTEQTAESAPTWYVEHFLAFGYSIERLEQAWAGLSDSARTSYRAVLVTPPEGTR